MLKRRQHDVTYVIVPLREKQSRNINYYTPFDYIRLHCIIRIKYNKQNNQFVWIDMKNMSRVRVVSRLKNEYAGRVFKPDNNPYEKQIDYSVYYISF